MGATGDMCRVTNSECSRSGGNTRAFGVLLLFHVTTLSGGYFGVRGHLYTLAPSLMAGNSASPQLTPAI